MDESDTVDLQNYFTVHNKSPILYIIRGGFATFKSSSLHLELNNSCSRVFTTPPGIQLSPQMHLIVNACMIGTVLYKKEKLPSM